MVRLKTTAFDNMENVMYYKGYNIGLINQVFSKLDDLQLIDTYSELNSLYQSNRYELVKNAISKKKKKKKQILLAGE